MSLTIINKVLKGAVVQDQPALYNYILPETGINSVQNALSSSNFEEVFIDCFTDSGLQYIQLPKISSFRRGFSPKIYVCNKGADKIIVNAQSMYGDNINFNASFGIDLNQCAYIHIVNNFNWALWTTPLAV